MLRGFQNQSGFTFLETILTTALLAAGLWGGLALFHNATSHSLDNDSRVIASQLASEKLETVIADKTFRGFNWITTANYPNEVLNAPYNGFSRSISITEVNANDLSTAEPGSGLKRVDVIVTWGPGPSQRITVTTLVTLYS